LATKKVSPAVRQTHPTAIDEFKNAYNVEFLGLAAEHSEADLHGALLRNLGRFLTELGRDVSASWRSS
jgi:predicted nuclease of restriction endonuclease-like (RecB) superfamily